MELSVRKETEGETTILKLKGILDISTVQLMEAYLNDIVGIKNLIFDFTELEFIDSTGIGAIINTIYLSQEKGFSLQFQGMNELTHEVFETIGLYQILDAIQKGVS
jgi:anti-anti-sigma factor